MVDIQGLFVSVINWKTRWSNEDSVVGNHRIQSKKRRSTTAASLPLQNICCNLAVSYMKIFTVDLQIAAVLLSPACQDEVVTRLDLKVFSFILVLEGRGRKNSTNLNLMS